MQPRKEALKWADYTLHRCMYLRHFLQADSCLHSNRLNLQRTNSMKHYRHACRAGIILFVLYKTWLESRELHTIQFLFVISSYDGSFSVFFYACVLPSCGLFFSFRLAYLYIFKSWLSLLIYCFPSHTRGRIRELLPPGGSKWITSLAPWKL